MQAIKNLHKDLEQSRKVNVGPG